MISFEYANAYTEILEILKYIPKEDFEKIPERKIKLFQEKANKEYKFNYNPALTLKEQNVSKITRTIIAILFRDYWATETQREKIVAKEKEDRIKIEKEKQLKYNPNLLFEKKSKDEKVQIIQYKQSILVKIINYFKSLFMKK